VQHIKIYLPCNFEVNPITHFDRLCKLEKMGDEVKKKNLLLRNHWAKCSQTFVEWSLGRKVLKFWKFDEKKGNNSKMGIGIYFKIAEWVDLDMPHIFCNLKLTFISYSFWNIRRKVLKFSLKVLDQWKPNLVWIITRVSSFKIVSGDAVHQPTL
jgi:hypothetical protein